MIKGGLRPKGIARENVKKHLHPNFVEQISGRNESKIKSLLESLGFTEGSDFTCQFPIGGSVRNGSILDFAFIQEQICIEADGKEHRETKKRKLDEKRDKKIADMGWVTIRIPDEEIETTFGLSFFRNLIREVVEDRRRLLYEDD